MRSKLFRVMLFGAVVIVPLIVLTAISVKWPATASAHPLGNFTVNRYSRLDLYSDVVRVHYVLDMAEIPTFQEMETIDRDGDGQVSDFESASYGAKKAAELRDKLHLDANGEPTSLNLLSYELSFPEGQGGLDTLRLSLLLEAPTSGSQWTVNYRDENYSDRIGWKEIVVQPANGIALLESSAPSEDISNELRAYPEGLLSSPLDQREASFSFIPGSGMAAPPVQTMAAEPEPTRPGNSFTSLITVNNLSLPVLLISLLAALGFGALHALEPGHGKTFVAAYFVGVKGTARQALLLGAIIAATHTLGVLAIGLVTLYGSRFILPERLYPWLSLASALIVVSLGLRLLIPRLKISRIWGRTSKGHEHPPSQGVAKEVGPASPWRSLIWLGLADGLTPSPSALVVLLAAVSLHRIGLGLLLILAFSAGLAAALTVITLTLVYARRALDRLSARPRSKAGWLLAPIALGHRLPGALPIGGALVLVVVGLILTVRALSASALLGA